MVAHRHAKPAVIVKRGGIIGYLALILLLIRHALILAIQYGGTAGTSEPDNRPQGDDAQAEAAQAEALAIADEIEEEEEEEEEEAEEDDVEEWDEEEE